MKLRTEVVQNPWAHVAGEPLVTGRPESWRLGANLCRGGRSQRGIAVLDLVVTIAVVGALGVVGLAGVTRVQSRRAEVLCLGQLSTISKAILAYAADHQSTLPGPVANQGGDFWWYYKDQIQGYVASGGAGRGGDVGVASATVFACPSDRGYTDAKPFWQSARFNHTSYVFNGVTLPGLPNVAGWKLDSVRETGRTLLVMEWAAHAPLSWHRSRTGNANAPFYNDAESVVAFVDGHAAVSRIYYDGYNAAYTRDPIFGYDYKYSGGEVTK